MGSFSYLMTAGCLFLLGLSGGMYDVPLQAYLQHYSPEKTRGSIFAATNLLTFTGTLLASGVFVLLGTVIGFSNRTIFLLVGVALIPLFVVLVRFTAYDTTRMMLAALVKLMYRVRVEGVENVPAGAVVIAPNHVSYADGVLAGLACPRIPRAMVFADYLEALAQVVRTTGAGDSRGTGQDIDRQVDPHRPEALRNGELVLLFPEGGVTRTGEMGPFQTGILAIVRGSNAPIIPTYIEGMWGSIFSFEGGRIFWKLPKHWFKPVTIRFGKPIYHPTDVEEIRRAVIELGDAGCGAWDAGSCTG